MKSFTFFAALLTVCFLIIHECDAGQRKTSKARAMWRKTFFILGVKKAASALCRNILSVETSCRSCNCQAPVNYSCRKLCAIREEIRKCATELLCPPTTTESTAASTATTAATATSTTTASTSATTESSSTTTASTSATTESSSTTTASTSATTESSSTTTASTSVTTESTSTTTASTSATTESTSTTMISAETTTEMTCGGFCVGGFCPFPAVGTCSGDLTCCSVV
ncbi:cell wall protein DAN4-like [Haliotis rufescens]|uniref:cell wall protein DAN4-like n=1 Tax=Haliotis rufescens TaxID=6454 RepID=UPI00201ED20E|nr:cell wall protein DAN4-like [Haliotis rufescens]